MNSCTATSSSRLLAKASCAAFRVAVHCWAVTRHSWTMPLDCWARADQETISVPGDGTAVSLGWWMGNTAMLSTSCGHEGELARRPGGVEAVDTLIVAGPWEGFKPGFHVGGSGRVGGQAQGPAWGDVHPGPLFTLSRWWPPWHTLWVPIRQTRPGGAAMQELLVCRFCGAEPGPSTFLDQCEVCEAWVCQRCGGVGFDEEAHGMVCTRCHQAIHHPVGGSPQPTH
jgi:hypothetical protein